jgi:hypothetical protein
MARPRFDPSRPLVAARGFTYAGQELQVGDPFPTEGLAPHKVRTLYGSRYLNHREGDAAPEAEATPEDVQMTALAGGYYEITAPWLEQPQKVRGKANAEKELARIREEGAPLGFIDGGTDVTITAKDGGWYDVMAPWLDEPLKEQGREAAEARQRELHAAGEPDLHHGVRLTAGENGWYTITRDGFDAELKVQGEDKAREAAATLRAGEMIDGQPVEWNAPEPLKVGDVVTTSEEGELAGLRLTINKIDGDNADVKGFEGEGDDAQLREGTVPLASLTPAEPEQAADGEDDQTDETNDTSGEAEEPPAQ